MMIFGVVELAITIMMVFGIPLVAILLGWIFLRSLKILKGEGTDEARKMSSEEARMMQEIHSGLSKLEKRIESLETILLDRSCEDRNP